MQRSKGGLGGLLVLCGALALGACGDKGGGSGSSSASSNPSGSSKAQAGSSSSPSTSGSAKASAPPAGSGSPKTADTGKAEADPFKDDSGPEEGVLSVDLSAAKDDAPPLGGTAPAPPPPPQGAKLDWLTAGPLSIPNPGWKLNKKGELGFLESPDKKAGLIFTGFKEPKEGLKKVDDICAAMQLKNMKWKKPVPVTLGPDKVPAMFGKGKGQGKDGKGAHLFYMLIKNTPQNLLAIGGADDDGGEPSLKVALNIMGNIKKGK